VKKPPRNSQKRPSVDTEDEFRVGPFPLIKAEYQNTIEHGTPLGQNLDTLEPAQSTDTRALKSNDPAYLPPRHSQVKNRTTNRTEPPVTRSRARNLSQDYTSH
jgi:hypothetical protein